LRVAPDGLDMANIDTTIFDTDLENMIADLPATLVWSGQTVSGMASEVSTSHDISIPGYTQDIGLRWQGRVGDFTSSTTPPVGDTVTVDSVSYRVSAKQITPDGTGVDLTLVDPAQ